MRDGFAVYGECVAHHVSRFSIEFMQRIGKKLAFQMSLFIILIVLVFGGISLAILAANNRASFRKRQERTAQQLSILLASFLFDMETEQIDTVVLSFIENPNIMAITVYDRETPIVVAAKDPETYTLLESPEQRPEYRNIDIRERDIVYFDEPMGRLEVVFTRQFEITQRAYYSVPFILVSALIVALPTSLVVIRIINKNVTMPLQNVITVAH
jgi:uncharacterized membrane protein affecting hemolysin expression